MGCSPGSALGDLQPTRILDLLARDQVEEAWEAFLRTYSSLILQVVELFTRDEDGVSDGYLFVCRHLSRRGCRRLRRFDPSGSARFSTWLHAVVYNLCRDWRRTQYPRRRAFRSISRLPAFDREVFYLHFERGMTEAETLEALRPRLPSVTEARVAESIEGLRARLSSRQLWLLQTRRPELESLTAPASDGREVTERQIPDPGSNPEAVASRREEVTSLDRALESLPAPDLLCLRLRFEQDLSLAEVARLMGLKNPQAADRRLRKILLSLRRQMDPLSRRAETRRRTEERRPVPCKQGRWDR